MQQATNAILRGGTIIAPSVSAKTIAEQLAEKINAKLNYTPVEKLEEERQAAEQAESITRYEEELEINDFPQVGTTQKGALDKVLKSHLLLKGYLPRELLYLWKLQLLHLNSNVLALVCWFDLFYI